MSNQKSFIEPYKIIDAGSMTGTSTLTSATFTPKFQDNLGLQMDWTGTPTGTFAVQGSLDGVSWTTITLTGLSNPAGAAGSNLAAFIGYPFPKLRVTYTNTSGSGSLTVQVCAKGN